MSFAETIIMYDTLTVAALKQNARLSDMMVAMYVWFWIAASTSQGRSISPDRYI